MTLALVPDTPDRFADDMRAAGFSLRIDDPDFVRRTRVMPFVHEATAMPLDVVLAASGLEEEFLTRAQPADIGGAIVPVIDVADLIIAKVLAGRPKDLDDARALWRIHGDTVDAGCFAGAVSRGSCGGFLAGGFELVVSSGTPAQPAIAQPAATGLARRKGAPGHSRGLLVVQSLQSRVAATG